MEYKSVLSIKNFVSSKICTCLIYIKEQSKSSKLAYN